MDYSVYEQGEIKPYPFPSPTPEQFAWFKGQFRPHFETMVVKPADELVNSPCIKSGAMPAFLWITCAIDWLAGFLYGEVRDNAVRESYKTFITTYFTNNKNYEFQADNLYIFRNGLIHNYTIKQNKGEKKRVFALTHNGIGGKHFDNLSNGQILLNLNDFFIDFVAAKDQYFNDVENKPRIFFNFAKCYEREGFLQIF